MFPKHYTYFPSGAQGLNRSCCVVAPVLAIHGASSPVVKHNTFAIRYSAAVGTPAIFSAPLTGADCPSLTTSSAGTTPIVDGFSRIYTLLAVADRTTGAMTLSWVNSADIDTHRGPLNESDFNLGDNTKCIVGTVYIKWEPNDGSTFIPGTTDLDASGATTIYSDAFGYVLA